MSIKKQVLLPRWADEHITAVMEKIGLSNSEVIRNYIYLGMITCICYGFDCKTDTSQVVREFAKRVKEGKADIEEAKVYSQTLAANCLVSVRFVRQFKNIWNHRKIKKR